MRKVPRRPHALLALAVLAAACGRVRQDGEGACNGRLPGGTPAVRPVPPDACPGGTVLVPGDPAGVRPSGSVDEVAEPVGPVCMDRTEVTVAAWEACVAAGACTPAGTGGACNAGQAGRADHPINCVDWCQAAAYCAWAGRRLPTASEWVWAARGPDQRPYPWGADFPGDDALCWKRWDFDRREGPGTCPVATPPRDVTPAGVAGLAGNVREWTASRWRTTDDDWWRGVRGGAWETDPRYGSVRAEVNLRAETSTRDPDLGFRCVVDATAGRPEATR